MRSAQVRTEPLYARHAAAADRGSWSLVSDIRWGAVDTSRVRSQQETLARVRARALLQSERGARTARLLARLAEDPHTAAALTLELWDGLKHFHALRTYLDTVEFAPRITDEEVAAARRQAGAFSAERSETALLLELLLAQHLAAAELRHLGASSEEPVLAELVACMESDESRRAHIIADLLRLRLSQGMTSAERLRAEALELRNDRSADWARSTGRADDLVMQTFLRSVEEICSV